MDERTKKIERWLEEKVKNHECPCCGGTNWAGGDIIEAAHYSPRALAPGEEGAFVPLALVICDNCAYVQCYSAIKMGLIR